LARQVWQARLLGNIIVVTPLLLELDGDHAAALLSRDELREALRQLEERA
jgi:hypothetical protein